MIGHARQPTDDRTGDAGDDAAVAVVVANLLADVLYGWLDPRIRY
jgi:hypothetical protein